MSEFQGMKKFRTGKCQNLNVPESLLTGRCQKFKMSNSDTIRFWHFQILTLSGLEQNCQKLRFWHFQILTLSAPHVSMLSVKHSSMAIRYTFKCCSIFGFNTPAPLRISPWPSMAQKHNDSPSAIFVVESERASERICHSMHRFHRRHPLIAISNFRKVRIDGRFLAGKFWPRFWSRLNYIGIFQWMPHPGQFFSQLSCLFGSNRAPQTNLYSIH